MWFLPMWQPGAMALAWTASPWRYQHTNPSIRVRGNRQAGRQANQIQKSSQETRPSPVPSTGRWRAKGFFKYTKSH
ncbi:hypothetical protein IWZ01DRAFT_490181 [Phyllosticta capitalensis]